LLSDDSEICIGKSTVFKVTFTGAAPFTYEYTNGTQSFGPFITSNNPAAVTVSPQVSTTYSLVSVTDDWCAGSVAGTAAVTVNPLPTPAITGIDEICDGETTTFTTGAYVTYQWSTGETTQAVSLNTGGAYSVTVTDPKGCTNSVSHVLTVHQTPVASFTNDTALSCETVAINLVNTSSYPAGSSHFHWYLGDGTTSAAVSPSHVFPDSGWYNVSLAIVTDFGCYDSTAQSVYAMYFPLPVANFKPDPRETSLFNAGVSFTDLSQHAVSWSWEFGNGLESSVQHPTVYFDEPGKYVITLTVTNITGCVDRYQEEIYITPFFVPNAFTPNGDGLNEEFFDVGYVMDVAGYTMSVFNRWGQKVFENDRVSHAWDGRDRNGDKAPQGTYVYAIKVLAKTGKEYYYTGHLNLIR
jgi:gliding motility-associated-like protein